MKDFTQLRTQKLVNELGIKIDGQEVKVITRNDQLFLDSLAKAVVPVKEVKEVKKPSVLGKVVKGLELEDLAEPVQEIGFKFAEKVNPNTALEAAGAVCRFITGQVEVKPVHAVKGFFNKPSVAKFFGYDEDEQPVTPVAEEVEEMEFVEESEYIMPGQDVLNRVREVEAVKEAKRNPFTVIKGGKE